LGCAGRGGRVWRRNVLWLEAVCSSGGCIACE